MDDKLTQRLESQLIEIKEKLTKKRTIKKIAKIHEKVGAIKAKLSRVGWLYDITYIEDIEKGIVTDIKWERKKEREKPKGEYFLRYAKNAISEDKIWEAYNQTRDVEAVFRCLKTDLDIRPIYHQKDKFIEPHIWLGILAYQVVNFIRRELKQNDINYSWSTIVEKMSSMQASVVSVKNDKDEKLYVKLCTRPNTDQKKNI
jgi:transposase